MVPCSFRGVGVSGPRSLGRMSRGWVCREGVGMYRAGYVRGDGMHPTGMLSCIIV